MTNYRIVHCLFSARYHEGKIQLDVQLNSSTGTHSDFRITAPDMCTCACRQRVSLSSTPAYMTSRHCSAWCALTTSTSHRMRPCSVTCSLPVALRGAGSPGLPVILFAVSTAFDLTAVHPAVGWGHNPYNTLVAGHDVRAMQSPAFTLMWLTIQASASGNIAKFSEPRHDWQQTSLLRVWCFNSVSDAVIPQFDAVILESSAVRCGPMR